ncbi:hypothetical protein DJ564_17760 [Pseudomonas sp. 31-12]|uniref:catalase n=1 Tax=Pseudomonas sp. 31-12 TaxID=2201356 RepID=UPI000D6B9A34|nr:catalase [Pseudomonas sp. 31-12]AWM92530.1 hypothetical protein DJ564_17760 [Pseudomonas sp. 31-12]
MNDKNLTHATGAPVVDNLNIQTAGPRGPALLQDIWLLEKLAHFDREVIPERRMHAKGAGAYGTFTVTADISHFSKASLFAEVGKQTPAFVRFSTVAGERGAADAERDIRGFAVKLYTDEGNWDIVGNNTPVFFFREAAEVVGSDRESHLRDLYECIESGEFPRWKLCIQTMTEEQARTHRHNPFDLTKVWPHGEFPLEEVGVLELNRNAENHFAEVEQAAFSPANVVPGVSFSPDKMLQARLFSYGDAQRYRLGVNFNHIPVNAPRCPFHSYHRDGAMRTDGNLGSTLSYFPNSFGEWQDHRQLHEPALALDGDAAHWDQSVVEDHYEQPGNLFRLMTPLQQQLLFQNTARAMGDAPVMIKHRHIVNCSKADPAYGDGVAQALGLSLVAQELENAK